MSCWICQQSVKDVYVDDTKQDLILPDQALFGPDLSHFSNVTFFWY